MFRFAAPAGLSLLSLGLVILLVMVLGERRRRAALARFGDVPLVARLSASRSAAAARWKGGLLVLAALFIGIAAARPQFGTRIETLRREGSDVVVAMDISQSMYARDVAPSRLERAKLEAARVIERMDGDRIGLVAFAGDAFVQSPLTSDYGAAMMFLRAMHPDQMSSQGTDLGRAIRVSLEALEESPPDHRVLILVSDGEDHEGGIPEALEEARAHAVSIHTVGVGSPEGALLPDPRGGPGRFLRDIQGNPITSRLNPTPLEDIAFQTGGSSYLVGPPGEAGPPPFEEWIQGQGREMESRETTLFEEQFQIFLYAALLILAAEFLVPARRRVRANQSGRIQ